MASAAEKALEWYYGLGYKELQDVGEWLKEHPVPEDAPSEIQHLYDHREEIEGVPS